MANNDFHVSISDNSVSVPLSVSEQESSQSLNTENGSPYYVGARAYVEQTSGGAVVTVIDKEGTTTATILNGADGADGADGQDGYTPIKGIDYFDGEDGQDGADGADGFSPTATVTKSGDTATITITDINGTTTATVSDGAGGTSTFEAEFGTTTYADVKDAYDDDEILICTVDDSGNPMVLQLVYFDVANEIFYFAFPMSDGWYWTQISNADGWDDGMWYFASTDVATQLRDGLMSALDKQKLDGLSKRNIWYGTCSTSASQSPKAITTASGDFELTTGSMLCVLFSHTNSLSSVSLQVDGGASKSAYAMDGTSDISNRWGSNEVVSFVYDGTKFVMLEQGLASTTQYGITKLNNKVTSTSTSEAATANAVKTAYDNGGVQSVNGSTGAVTVTVPTITDTYDGTSSDGMSGKAVKSAIDALDGTVSGSAGSDKTLTAFSQTDGKVSATFGNISITKSQVSDFPTIPTNVSDLNNDSGFLDASGVLDLLYPVGSYYETSDSTFDPPTSMGGQWSCETISNNRIVEEGTSGMWTYRKWSSGIAECWGQKNITASATTAWGSWYYIRFSGDDYPTNLFTSVTSAITQIASSIDFASSSRNHDSGGATLSTTTPPDVLGVRPTNYASTSSATGYWHTIGRWKTYSAPNTIYRWRRTS